jgi:hypothetical protein
MPNGIAPAYVNAAVEGIVDDAALRRIFNYVNVVPHAVYGRNGKQFLLSRMSGYNHSARFRKWVVLVDLDHAASCAPEILPSWLPLPAAYMCLRVAVREIESWLLADKQRIAQYLAVRTNLIPDNTDLIVDPKAQIVTLATQSRRSDIRQDMVARTGSGQKVGPAYASRMIEFIQNGWRPEIAAENSDSLQRSIVAIRRLAAL